MKAIIKLAEAPSAIARLKFVSFKKRGGVYFFNYLESCNSEKEGVIARLRSPACGRLVKEFKGLSAQVFVFFI
jgi:hypothetical protein